MSLNMSRPKPRPAPPAGLSSRTMSSNSRIRHSASALLTERRKTCQHFMSCGVWVAAKLLTRFVKRSRVLVYGCALQTGYEEELRFGIVLTVFHSFRDRFCELLCHPFVYGRHHRLVFITNLLRRREVAQC